MKAWRNSTIYGHLVEHMVVKATSEWPGLNHLCMKKLGRSEDRKLTRQCATAFKFVHCFSLQCFFFFLKSGGL